MRAGLTASILAIGMMVWLSPRVGAQTPGVPDAPRFGVAEVRAVVDVPVSAEDAFANGVAGTRFANSPSAVVARFSAEGRFDGTALSVVWTFVGRSGAPARIAESTFPSSDLSRGILALLDNNGRPLDPGRYQVSVVGSDARVFRTIEFFVVGTSRVGRASGRPAGLSNAPARPIIGPFLLDGISFVCPTGFRAQNYARGTDTAIAFTRPGAPEGLFVVGRTGGRFDLRASAESLLEAVARFAPEIGPVHATGSYDVADLTVAGVAAAGRVLLGRSQSGRDVHVTLYERNTDDRSVVVGYFSFASASPGPTQTSSPLGASRPIVEDFHVLVESLREVAPPQAPAPEPRRRPNPLDVARASV